ncbi:hypothetical protein FACS1894189_3610 [Planctomycetales bacterium]|nr:hypothetical protein FACS1894189_3610 [Planctomycetales bacterium]
MKVIGGSTIAAILGLSKWQSPHSVFLRLTGKLESDQEGETLERGKAAEPVVASMYALNHPEYIVEEAGMMTNAEHEYLVASPDRLLFDAQNYDTPVSGLEVKTADLMLLSEWGEEDTDEIPVPYLCQCQWYAGFFGVQDWKLAVGFVKSGTRKVIQYREYCVKHNQERYDAMISRAIDFWEQHVVTGNEPPITEPDSDTIRYYRSKYPAHESGKWIEATNEVETLAKKITESQFRFKEAEHDFETYKTQMIALLADAEGVKTSAGNITYRQSKPTLKTDWKTVAEAMLTPKAVIDQFTTETPGSRRFLISKRKEC